MFGKKLTAVLATVIAGIFILSTAPVMAKSTSKDSKEKTVAKKKTTKKKSATKKLPASKINVNKANTKDLEQLPGVGPVISERIASYRKKHGSFKKVEDLINVEGIGKKTLADMKSFIILQ